MSKKILVTGGAGYIGSKIVADLIKKKKVSKIIHCANLYNGNKKKIFKINFIYAKKIFCASYNKKIKFYYFYTIYSKLKNVTKNNHNYNYLISKKKFIEYVKKNIKNKKITFINIITPTIFGLNSKNNDLSSRLIKALKKNKKFTINYPKKIKKFLSLGKFLLDFKKIYRKEKLLNKYYEFTLN